MWNWLKKSKQVLGLNARSLDYIKPGNPKRAIRLVDNKLRTKKLLRKNNIPVSDLIAVVRGRKDFYTFDWSNLPKSFALKPTRGHGGAGIMVTFGRSKSGRWVLPLNRSANEEDIKLRVSNILDGNYSLGNAPDSAFFEERLKIHPVFKLYSYKGIPDIRIIVYNKVPVMAMLRLPTRSSDGKANLHKGGVGVGIDIATGSTTYAVQYDTLIQYHPDIQLPLWGIKIPFWDQILEMAIKSAQVCGLSYTGVDIAIDREKGPIILELNARPGLSIQIANLAPLKERLNRVEGLKVRTAKKGIKVAKELFGGELEHEIEEITGKRILGIINKVKVKTKTGEIIEVEAKLDTGAGISSIDADLARKIGFGDAIDHYEKFDIKNVLTKEEVAELEEKKIWKQLVQHKDIVDYAIIYSSHGISYRIEIPIKLELAGLEISSNASVINREHLQYPIIIGRRDLKHFLLDPTKN